MSFKRDGYDGGFLKKLQRRRVTEILGDHIPDDEAKLLSNGRLTCTVCSRKPIFDTMQMLSLHRKGKKHLYELSRYLQYKRCLEYKKCKETERSFLKTEQTTTASDSSSALSLVSCVRNQTKRKSCSNFLRKKITTDITPSCNRIKTTLNPSTPISFSANSQVRQYLKSLSRKRPLEKTVTRLRETYGGRGNHIKARVEPKSESVKSEGSMFCTRGEVNFSQRLKLLESGWIQDLSGKWVKDPNVEFDSDEEEPGAFQ